MKRFGPEPMFEVWSWLAAELSAATPGAVVCLEAPNPDLGAVLHVPGAGLHDLGAGLHAGEAVDLGDLRVRHRSLRCWSDLAESLVARLLVPEPVEPGWVRLRFQRLDFADSFHADRSAPPEERYGAQSPFARIDKLEEPSFLAALAAAYRRVALPEGARVLDVGVGSAAELELMRWVYGEERFGAIRCVGLDHSATILDVARARLPLGSCEFVQGDLNDLDSLTLGRFDLLLAVGTLQSSSLRDGRALFQTLVTEHLTERGAVILGLPNCRYASGEALYGAWTPNHNHSELSLVAKDVDFYRRYLHQHRFRVTVTGKLTLLVTATRIGAR